VHYKYALGIVLFILIVALTGWWYHIPEVVQILSFGLALSSLVLAVIAIFQALMSNAEYSKILGDVRAVGNDIKEASSQLLQRTEAIPSALGEISQRLDQALNRPSDGTALTETEGGANDTDTIITQGSVGGVLSLYCCVLSFEKKKTADPKIIFNNNRSVYNYVMDFVTGLKSYKNMDIDLLEGKFTVRDLGKIDPAVIKREIARDTKHN
jgi:hypothetical protein